MIDTLATLRGFLTQQSALTALTGQRIYAGVVYPPPDYAPGQHALCFNIRSGSLTYDRQLLAESFTFKCYGADEPSAMLLYRTLADALDDRRGGRIRHAELETSGYPLREPDTGWPFVLTYFRVTFEKGQ